MVVLGEKNGQLHPVTTPLGQGSWTLTVLCSWSALNIAHGPTGQGNSSWPCFKDGNTKVKKTARSHRARDRGVYPGESLRTQSRALPGSALLLLLCIVEALQGGTAWYSDPQGAPP